MWTNELARKIDQSTITKILELIGYGDSHDVISIEIQLDMVRVVLEQSPDSRLTITHRIDFGA